MAVAKVIIDVALDQEFDYRIPESLAGTLKVGMMVTVPFGRTTRDGYILSFAESSDYPGKLREIIKVSTTRAHVPEHLVELGRWMADYYCCSQEQKVPNRFIAMPSRRNRIMGVLSYVYDLAGFLQWGFNFYFSQYSRKLIDPFASTDSDGAFPAGDPFLVYPGQGGKPLDSIRHEVFYDGLQDLRALRLLESKIGREAVLALIGEHLTMEEYPRRDEWLRGMRERVYRELAARR